MNYSYMWKYEEIWIIFTEVYYLIFIEDVTKKASVFSQEDLRRMCHGKAGDEVSDKIDLYKTVAIVSHHGALRVSVCFFLSLTGS